MNSIEKQQMAASIRLLRKSAGLNQTDLSKKLNVKQSTISRWETGIDQPSIENMSTLVGIFNCTFDELICGAHEKRPEELKLSIYRNLSKEKRSKLLKFIEEIL